MFYRGESFVGDLSIVRVIEQVMAKLKGGTVWAQESLKKIVATVGAAATAACLIQTTPQCKKGI